MRNWHAAGWWVLAAISAAGLAACAPRPTEEASTPAPEAAPLTASPAAIDHIIYQAADLDAGAAAFSERSGVAPGFGGAHVSGGTANYLASLGGGAYLEIIGPAAGRDPSAADRGAALAAGAEELATFALRVEDADATAAALRERNIAVDGPFEGGRTTPEGRALRWRTITIEDGRFCDYVPFAIEWLEGTTHPSETSPAGLSLVRFEIEHPEAGELNAIYEAFGAPLRAREGDATAMRAVLSSPKGELVLERKSPPCEGAFAPLGSR